MSTWRIARGATANQSEGVLGTGTRDCWDVRLGMASPSPAQRQMLALALQWFERGLLGVAEAVGRRLLAEGFEDPAVHNLLGRVALRVERPDVAAREFRRALDLNPGFKPASKNLKEAEGLLASWPPPPDGVERYLLIRAWQQGFWADVDHVMGQVVLAEATGRVPIVHWGRESRFSSDASRDAWGTFFEPVSGLTLADVRGKGFDFYPPRWSEGNLEDVHLVLAEKPEDRPASVGFLNRRERVAVSTMHASMSCLVPWLPAGHAWHGRPVREVQRRVVERFVRPRREIVEEVDRFAREAFGGGRMVALHLRGSDKTVEDPGVYRLHMAAIEEAKGRAERLDGRVFLLTDSTPALEAARGMLKDRLVTADATRTDSAVGLHFQDRFDRRALGHEVLRDALIAARCDEFVGLGTSTVSASIRHLKDWAPGACVLLGEVMHDLPNIWMLLPSTR